MNSGPGPKYGLPGLTGYIQHDPTRKVEPAYTIRNRHEIKHPSQVPGPDRYSLFNKTSRGIHQAPAYTLGTKDPDKSKKKKKCLNNSNQNLYKLYKQLLLFKIF